MEFKNSKGIFQQIADNLCDRILENDLKVGDKVPSVREQAASIGVNHNTIMRTYTELQRENIILNKRGIGFFVAENAPKLILDMRREEFQNNVLPDFIHQLKLLKISKEEIFDLITKFEENENK